MPKGVIRFTGTAVCLILLCFSLAETSSAGVLYKRYLVRKDRGADILCEPHVVEKNEYLYMLLRKKGEISHRDFPEFIKIFGRINSHIKNINKLHPNDEILIPLRKLKRGEFPDQESGFVDIPFVTISALPRMLFSNSSVHKIKRGEYVSGLISDKFGKYGSKRYHEGVKVFKIINPDIKNLNLIRVGQLVNLPSEYLPEKPWYPSIFDNDGNIKTEKPSKSNSLEKNASGKNFIRIVKKPDPQISPIIDASKALGTRLIKKGVYYLPTADGNDLKINFGKTPSIVLNNGLRVIFYKEGQISEKDLTKIEKASGNIKTVKYSPSIPSGEIVNRLKNYMGGSHLLANRLSFTDKNVEIEVRSKWILDKDPAKRDSLHKVCVTPVKSNYEKTSPAICRYLYKNSIIIRDLYKGVNISEIENPIKKKRKGKRKVQAYAYPTRKETVREILKNLNISYSENVPISFPYSGIQIEAVSNLIPGKNGTNIILDFGNLYGDAVYAIERNGFKVLSVTETTPVSDIFSDLSELIGVMLTKEPTFLAAERPALHNTTISLPGFLLQKKGVNSERILVTDKYLDPDLVAFLNGIKVRVFYSS